jgi:hypothetical protein
MVPAARIFLILPLLAWPPRIQAQEVSAGLGLLRNTATGDLTYSWQLQYFMPLGKTLAASVGYLNEGHVDDHHRDEYGLQLWAMSELGDRARLGLGLGAFAFFDTTRGQDPSGYQDSHGLLAVASLRAEGPALAGRWVPFIQANRTFGGEAPHTLTVLVGCGLTFGPAALEAGAARPGRTAPDGQPNEVTFMVGKTVLNDYSSPSTPGLESYALGYRRTLAAHWDASLTYCDEGRVDSATRKGLAAQFWGRAEGPGFALSAGLGPYFNRVYPAQTGAPPDLSQRTALRCSLLATRRIWRNWEARFQWDRTLSDDNRDTDAFLAGIGYCW